MKLRPAVCQGVVTSDHSCAANPSSDASLFLLIRIIDLRPRGPGGAEHSPFLREVTL